MSTTQSTNWSQQRDTWAAKAAQLSESHEAAQKARGAADKAAAENPSLDAASAKAGLAELAAAKAYNDFLETGATAYKLSLDVAQRLRAGNLSLLDRNALEIEQRNLEQAAAEFQSFKSQSGLGPVSPSPVYADSKVYSVDGSVRWDNSGYGQLGAAWDGLKHALPELARAATLSNETQYEACRGVVNALTDTLAGKVLPAPGAFNRHAGEVWDQISSKAFPAAPAETTCRLIYPPAGVPAELRKYGRLTEGHDAVLGHHAAFDVDAALLAGFGLADALATSQARGRISQDRARQWLRQATGVDDLPLAPPPITLAEPAAPQRDDPRHPLHCHHALYATLQDHMPYASEERLVQFTAACHMAGITAQNFFRVIPLEETDQVWFARSWPPGPFAKVDLNAPMPTPQQAMQQVQEFDQQETIRQAALDTQWARFSQQHQHGSMEHGPMR